ncbi:MAG: ATP-binding protein [Jatrophihabitantaceae bacterium]
MREHRVLQAEPAVALEQADRQRRHRLRHREHIATDVGDPAPLADLSPTEAIRSLAGGLEQLSPTGEIDQLTEVAVRATRAQAAALWLLDGDRWSLASVYPADVPAPDRAQSWPVSYQGEHLGGLAVDGELVGADEALLADLSAHAGLVVHNALLTVQLARQVAALTEQTAELSRTRRCLVETQDTERRRLERDLHDGAQQELVACIAAIGAAAVTRPAAPDLVRLSAQLRRMLTEARASMLELCGDGRSSTLVELGLAGALRRLAQLAAQSGVSTVLEVTESPPPPEIEAAAYFCCAEALQNVAKYAQARTATVWIRLAGDGVDLTVADDGRGFDPAATARAGGLSTLQDRLAGVGGELAVASAPGRGTTLHASIPMPA